MISVDEAITHLKEMAEEKYKQGFLCYANSGNADNDKKNDELVECGKKYEQIAYWLEEFKSLKDKDTPIKAEFQFNTSDTHSLFKCKCGYVIHVNHDKGVMKNNDAPNFCKDCGVKFNWDYSDN